MPGLSPYIRSFRSIPVTSACSRLMYILHYCIVASCNEVSDIKGTYEVPEAYRRAASKAPAHVFDHEPDEDDVAFMKQAVKASKKSPDLSAQVSQYIICHTHTHS